MKTEEDINYLEEKFPKGETKFRGEAMTLLAIARAQGIDNRNTEVKQAIESLYEEGEGTWISGKELLQKLGLDAKEGGGELK